MNYVTLSTKFTTLGAFAALISATTVRLYTSGISEMNFGR